MTRRAASGIAIVLVLVGAAALVRGRAGSGAPVAGGRERRGEAPASAPVAVLRGMPGRDAPEDRGGDLGGVPPPPPAPRAGPGDPATLLVRLRGPAREPVEGVPVRVTVPGELPRETTTDASGVARFARIEAPRVEVTVLPAGDTWEPRDPVALDLAPGSTEWTGDLAPAGRVRGRVVDGATGRPLPGVKVGVRGVAAGVVNGRTIGTYGYDVTDGAGRFTVGALPVGLDLVAFLWQEGFAASEAPVRIPREVPREAEAVVRASPGGWVDLVTVRADGAPAADAWVTGYRDPPPAGSGDEPLGDILFSARTGADGTTRVLGLPLDVPFTLEASVGPWERSPFAEPVLLTAERPAATLRLEGVAAVPVTLLLLDERGSALDEEAVAETAEVEGDGRCSRVSVLLDTETRRVAWSCLAYAGRRTFRARVPGFLPAEVTVAVRAGEAQEVAIPLRPSASIQGRVLDASDARLEGVDVSVHPAGRVGEAPLWEGTTDEEGRFLATGFPAGRYDLWARDGLGREACLRAVGAPAGGVTVVLGAPGLPPGGR